MTFTDADHAKAVELYERFKDAEWWPRKLAITPDGCWADDGCEMTASLALSIIAWAMVERFDGITLQHRENRGWSVYLFGDWHPTRFLALAAAVEALPR